MSTDARPFEGYEEWELDMIAAGDWPDEVSPTLLRYARSASNCQWELKLRAALYRATCPSAHDLAERALALLTRERSAEIDAHLAACPHCTAEMEELSASGGTTLPFVERARGVVRHIVLQLMELLSPSQPRLALQGLRGALWSATYQGEQYTLSLMKQQGAEGIEIMGGLLGAIEEGGEVQLRQGSMVVAQSPLSLAATFTLKQPPPGDYELLIITGTDELHVPNLPLHD